MRLTLRRPAFTMAELVVVLAIIIILMTILIPVVGKVRKSAQAADTRQQLSVISQAIENYHNDFSAYPGPVSNINAGASPDPGMANRDNIVIKAGLPNAGSYVVSINGNNNLTMSENLVLGLVGGLEIPPVGSPYAAQYNPALIFPNIGASPASFSPGAAPGANGLNRGLPKHFGSYMSTDNLSQGYYHDDIINILPNIDGASPSLVGDTMVPEFLDRFPGRMPILYLRAHVGAGYNRNAGAVSADNNNVITDGTQTGQYDLSQIVAYTQNYPGNKCVGEGKATIKYFEGSSTQVKVAIPYHGLGGRSTSPAISQVDVNSVLGPPGPGYYYPYDAYAYFKNPTLGGNDPTHIQDVARQKDGYILISAGADRIYGTDDDICNFGNVVP